MKPVAWMVEGYDGIGSHIRTVVSSKPKPDSWVNITPLYTAPRELSRSDIYGLAIEAGFMLSTQYGQAEDKLMPVTDGETLMKLADLILKKASEK